MKLNNRQQALIQALEQLNQAAVDLWLLLKAFYKTIQCHSQLMS